ncbi:MAG: ECF-type sigma factor [Gammaproteobacteria bacterium]
MTCPTLETPATHDLSDLMPQVYDELLRIARHHLRRQSPGATLNTTAVVHEAYLRLADGRGRWSDRGHFLALASRAMRQLIVDHARRRLAVKRGDGALHVTLSEAAEVAATPAIDPLAVEQALVGLAALDPVLERVVECRFYAGLSVEETALALTRSTRSVERDWARARAYLFDALQA